ncbi:hypothetical protein [Demequina sp. NBRC 110056]|uniref:hypothetical protein n=1 Tax=Demequina sp. NBRC 110056 TaxID=1570345 RepID=UPI0009FDB9A6|nr:hypothetical protein [Demequina sp. NBRC 110056]
MAKDDDGLTARPGEDPYELEWPDDAKDQRAAEREAVAAAGAVKPVSRGLAALVIGVGLTLLCVLPLGVIGGQIGFFLAVAAPVILGGVLVAWPTGLLLDRVVRRMPTGVGEIAFVLLGGAVGYGLTWGGLTLFQEALFASAQDLEIVRSQGSIFMMTATAVGFLGAYMLADKIRPFPKQVMIIGGFIVVMFVASVAANLFGTGGA